MCGVRWKRIGECAQNVVEFVCFVRAICICVLWIDYGHTSVTRLNGLCWILGVRW